MVIGYHGHCSVVGRVGCVTKLVSNRCSIKWHNVYLLYRLPLLSLVRESCRQLVGDGVGYLSERDVPIVAFAEAHFSNEAKILTEEFWIEELLFYQEISLSILLICHFTGQ